MLEDLPVLGICGHSGSDRTTLVEQVVPHLRKRRLKVAVLTHDALGVPAGPGCRALDRLAAAGADVLLQGSSDQLLRVRAAEQPDALAAVEQFIRRYDLVLVVGLQQAGIPKVWLLKEGEDAPPAETPGVLKVLPWRPRRCQELLDWLAEWLPAQCNSAPVFGCVLAGGHGGRLSPPRTPAARQQRTCLERCVEVVSQVSARVVVAGGDGAADGLAGCVRLPDAPDAAGPMAGLLAAMRWAPQATWLVTACDMPHVNDLSLRWLLSHRKPGVWAVLPVAEPAEGVEPLLAWYGGRARDLLEGMARRGEYRLRRIAGYPEVFCPQVPPHLRPAWGVVESPASIPGSVRDQV
jgi:molybdopterin-guanine dinucleotide biosynthesis protein MobB